MPLSFRRKGNSFMPSPLSFVHLLHFFLCNNISEYAKRSQIGYWDHPQKRKKISYQAKLALSTIERIEKGWKHSRVKELK